jgi:hypothetical protein
MINEIVAPIIIIGFAIVVGIVLGPEDDIKFK